MKTEILYVELKHGHSGPAWIGYGQFSKSGKSVYFNGRILKKGQGINSNHFDIENGDEYWISGVKKNGEDRHWAGSGKIYLDKSAVDEYLNIIGQAKLPKNKFILVDLINISNKELSKEIENNIISEKFDTKLLYNKTPKDLNNKELQQVIKYYNDLDLTAIPLKSRKDYIEKLKELSKELSNRNLLYIA